jgi:GH25 family lysozyme M1 (1,4-beta-N-acetylmuramidase)
MMEPAAIESVSQSTFSIKAFTAHPYKNLEVSNWDKKENYQKVQHQIPNN